MTSWSGYFSTDFNQHVPDFYRIFNVLDADHDELLGKNDLKALFEKLNHPVSDEDLDTTMTQILSSASGQQRHITFSVYLNWIYRTLQQGSLEGHLAGIFEVLDKNHDGRISPSEVVEAVRLLGNYDLRLEDAKSILGAELDYGKFCELLAKSLPAT